MLTARQKDCLNLLLDYQDAGKGAPSRQEIADYLGIAKSNAQRVVKDLEDRGFIEIGTNQARRITVLQYPDGKPTEIGPASTLYIRGLEKKIEDLEEQIRNLWIAKRRGW